MAISKCSYPECPGYPPALRSLCLWCNTKYYHHICQTDLEQELDISLELTQKCHRCIWNVAIDDELEKKRREEATAATVLIQVISSPVDTIATNVEAVRDDFNPN